MLENPKTFFYFIHSSSSLYSFIFLVSVIGVKIFNILKFLEKSLVKLSLHLVEMDPDPDQKDPDADPDVAKLFLFDRIRIRNLGLRGSVKYILLLFLVKS
jgi:hypothetical protein